jgi:hypothetical protein
MGHTSNLTSPLKIRNFVTDWPPLWSSVQSSWLQIWRSGFDSRCYQIFWEVVGLERGPLSLVSTIEELLERKSSGSCLLSREYCRRDPSRWPRSTLYPQKLALTSSTSDGRSVGIVRTRTQATEFSFSFSQGHRSLYTAQSQKGRAIARGVIRWRPTAVARVRTWVTSCGICGGQSGTGVGFVRVLHSTAYTTLIIHHPGWYIRPNNNRHTKWIQSHPTPGN